MSAQHTHLPEQHQLAREFYDRGAIQEARDLALKLSADRPQDAKLANDLGVYEQGLGNVQGAEQAFLAAIKNDPRASKPYYNLGTFAAL